MKYADLAPLIAIEAAGAPVPLISLKLAEAAHEFFRLTRAYIVEQRLTSVAAQTKTVALDVPPQTAFIEVSLVRLGSKQLTFLPSDKRPADLENYVGSPRHYTVDGSTVRLVPYPEQDISEPLVISFSVQPLLTAKGVADPIGQVHQDAMLAGAKSRLFRMSRKDWTDVAAAGIEEVEFRRLVNEARIRARNEGSSETDVRARGRFV